MPSIKDLNYSNEELLLAQIGKAISHPARAKMILFLLNNGTFRNIDFSNSQQLSVTATHHHIYQLINADLVNLEYVNHQYFVTLKPESLFLLQNMLAPSN